MNRSFRRRNDGQSGNRKHRKRRFVFWTVLVFAATLWAMIGVSFFTGAELTIYSVLDQNTWSQRSLSIEMHTAAVSLEYYPDIDPYHGSENTESIDFYFGIGGPYSASSRIAWLWPSTWRGGSSAGNFIRWELPLATPTLILSGFSLIMILRSRSRRSGHCHECGYDRRDNPTPTCPECGHTAAAP